MKKSKNFLLACFIAIMAWANCNNNVYANETVNSYLDIEQIAHETILKQQKDDYYIIYYMEGCSDCEAVEAEMCEFASNQTVYAVSYENNKETILHYNWSEHRAKYDKDIGIYENGQMLFYEGESEEKYYESNEYNEINKKIQYEIIIADNAYLKRNPLAKQGHIYASVLTPVIDYKTFKQESNVVIAGYPTLFHIVNGTITDFYYDVPEIREYLNQR